MTDNQDQQTCESDTNYIKTTPQGWAIKSHKTGTLEAIIRQSESHKQQDKDWSYTEAGHETSTDDVKAST